MLLSESPSAFAAPFAAPFAAATGPRSEVEAETGETCLRRIFFETLPPTWLIDRHCTVLDANAAARALARAGEPVVVTAGRLRPRIANGDARLAAAVAGLAEAAHFFWPDHRGHDVGLHLRLIGGGQAIAATLVAVPDPVAELAPVLMGRLGLSERQSQIAAHLLAGHSLAATARALGISRTTAVEHLAAAQKRLGHATRQALLAHLLAACR